MIFLHIDIELVDKIEILQPYPNEPKSPYQRKYFNSIFHIIRFLPGPTDQGACGAAFSAASDTTPLLAMMSFSRNLINDSFVSLAASLNPK